MHLYHRKMIEQIKISVIIPTYNRADVVGRAILSALKQTYTPFEIIVIDDGSSDKTAETVRKFSNSVTYVEQKNSGPASARNNGIQRSTGNYIAFLDSDDEWMPDKLEKQIELINSKHAQVVITNSLFKNRSNSAETTFSKSLFSDLLNRFDSELTDCFPLLIEQNFIHLSTLLVQKSCLLEVGYFDEGMPVAEDTDLWLRLAFKYKFGIITTPLAIRDDRPDKLSGNKQKEYSGRLYMFSKFLRSEADLSSEKKDLIRQRQYFIRGRFMNSLFQKSDYVSLLKNIFSTNPAYLTSKYFYKGYYWNSKEFSASKNEISE